MPLSWDMSSYDTKLRKLRNYPKWLAWPPISLYEWYDINLLENKPFCVEWYVYGDTSLHYTQQLSVALSLGNFSSYSMCFVDHYLYYHYFSKNWLCSKLSVIYLDCGVKPATFGDISVFSVFWRHGSYLSWEASQQNFVFIFLLHLTSPNFWDNKIFLAGTKFNITRNIYC